MLGACGILSAKPLVGQEPAVEQPAAEAEPAGEAQQAADASGETDSESPKPVQDQADPSAEPVVAEVEVPSPIDAEQAKVTYPRAVAVAGEKLYIVDLDLPGIWLRTPDELKVYTPGTKLLRKPVNRPWAVAVHPDDGILIGDSASREIYAAAGPGTTLKALNNGYLGIPMALAVGPEGKTVYVGDAERRAVFRLPIDGGKPELVARVNARGLSFDADGKLWAITPDADAVQRIDVDAKTAEAIIVERPYQFPNGIVWVGDHGFVTDGYGKSIWKFTADGQTEKWFEGEPLVNPVGITADDKFLYVADPRKEQVFRFDRQSKQVEPLL
ncbi:hypothetical protein FYK55_10900 [Roseiconus nitratireducens]|uniref:Uncharacterized protein n=1 Tax=Roseiconus nitratireducens TaxID=2605748 RepID=A0A5M6D966_9BACT|nr:hypothetical protein FYK55_10900 [Roseiconus nitratireducens]